MESALTLRSPAGVEEIAAAVARAERLLGERRYEDTLASLASVQVPTVSSPALVARVLHCEASANRCLGRFDVASALDERARALSFR